MKTIFTNRSRRSLICSASLAATLCFSATAIKAQSAIKSQTSDPYFSKPRQMQADKATSARTADFSKPAIDASAFLDATPNSWEHPIEKKTTQKSQTNAKDSQSHSEVWESLSRKTIKPVQRIDFSKFQVSKEVQKELAQTASAWAVPETSPPREQPHKLAAGKLRPLKTSAPQTVDSHDHFKKTNPLMPLSQVRVAQDLPVTPATVAGTSIATAQSNQPKPDVANNNDFQARPLNPAVASNFVAPAASHVEQVTYTTPTDDPFVPGQNLKKLGNKIKKLSGVPASGNNDPGYRIADSRTEFESYSEGTLQLDSTASANGTIESYQGESFEMSRVVALVGGHPIFKGDMIFEINQLLEKYMKGAPEEAKAMQRDNLIKRLLPKYVDQKMLFISTLNDLPEEADIEDILKQAEKTFNEKALPEIMKKSGVTSTSQFDANMRAQGSSIRQMRRAWAKDQVSRYFLAERVTFSKDVTHVDLLDEYRAAYDSYLQTGKCRWEQIEIQFDKAGGRFAAKDKAAEIYDRLVHGGNFEAIAKKESHGYKAAKGGQHDWTNQDSLVNKAIDKVIFSAPEGRLAEIIETKTACHIVRVIERIDTHHTPFEEAQAKIKENIIEKRRDKAFKDYLAQLRKEIPVEYPE